MPTYVKHFLCVIIVCLAGIAKAQDTLRDEGSLVNIKFVKSSSDTARVNMFIKLSNQYLNNKNVERGIIYSQKALALTIKIKWNKGLAKSYLTLGRAAYIKNNYNTSIDYQKRSSQMFKEFHDVYDEAAAQFHLAESYLAVGEKNFAIQSYTKSIEMLSEKNQSPLLVSALIHAGQLYQSVNNVEKAIDCYLEAKNIADQNAGNDVKEICSFYLSEMYGSLHEYEKAVNYALEAWKCFCKENQSGRKTRELELLDRVVIAYASFKDFKNALEYAGKALVIAEQLNRPTIITRLKTNMAWAYYSLGNYNEAYPLAKEIIESNAPEANKLHDYNTFGCILRDAPDTLLKRRGVKIEDRYNDAISFFLRSLKNKNQLSAAQNYLDLSITYERINNLSDAYKAYKYYVVLRDSSDKEEIQKKLLKKEAQFEFSKKEDSLKYSQQISDEKLKQQSLLATQRQQALLLNSQWLSLVNKQAAIVSLKYLKSQANLAANENLRKANMQQLKVSQKDKALAQATVLLQRAVIKSKLYQGYYFLTGLAVLLLLSGFIWFNYFNQRKLNRLLSTANVQIVTANTALAEQREEITSQRDHLAETIQDLKSAQNQLIQSEKMASLGELTAGIAHEIQNPLNFVNNFSDVNREMAAELKEVLIGGNIEEALAISRDILQNEEKINYHGKRADAIVKGMLEHSRTGSGEKQATDINKLAAEFLKLSYHAIRAKDNHFNAGLLTHFNSDVPMINMMQQDIGRVLLNIYNNAFYALQQKQKAQGPDYKPVLEVATNVKNGFVEIYIKDNGIGIPDAIKGKILQPFFTTKPTGEGTGLGLSISYDIVVKAHSGKIDIESVEGENTQFSISLPC